MTSPRLVMTLLVRDEEDILEDNITFHLAHGVDFIVALDNGSKDSTPKILSKYAQKGYLSYKVNKKQTYEQSKWVSQMAKEAVEKYGATHLFHCDADEFWLPKSGNLKSNLPSENEVIYVPSVNYLPARNKLVEFLHIRTTVIQGFSKPKHFLEDTSSKYLLFGYYPKIFTSAKFTNITQGNHDVNGYSSYKKTKSKGIIIRHFPIRTYQQFERKVINGGYSYSKNPIKNTNVGWHWRTWYDIYLKGDLEKEYKKISLTSEYRKYLISQGVVQLKPIPWRIAFSRQLFFLYEIQCRLRKFFKSLFMSNLILCLSLYYVEP